MTEEVVLKETSFEECVLLAEKLVKEFDVMEDERLTFFYLSSVDLYKESCEINEDSDLIKRLNVCIKSAERAIVERYTNTYRDVYETLNKIFDKIISKEN